MKGTNEARYTRLSRAMAIALPVVLLVPLVLSLRGQATAQNEYQEMIPFNHRVHIAAGTPCLFCHPNALNGPVASIPSVVKCVGCHQSVEVRTEEGQAQVDTLMRFWQEGRPLRWPKIVDMPDFVYFAHRPHIAVGFNCENCHGNVSHLTMARYVKRINMGFCLNYCHRHQDAERRERLMDYSTCHM